MSLEDLCYQKMAQTMNDAPPVLQEFIMGGTSKAFKKEVRKDVIKKEVKSMCEIIPDLVPEIMEDIIKSISRPTYIRTDFMAIYKHLRPEMVECAIKTAEAAVSRMEERYVHSAFPSRRPVLLDSDEDDPWDF